MLSNYAEHSEGRLPQSENNCVSGNHFSGATFPPGINKTWGCTNKTPEPRWRPAGGRIPLDPAGRIEVHSGKPDPSCGSAGASETTDDAEPL